VTDVHDVIIVGSGPSGSAVAKVLIEAGIRPLVIDGGGQTSDLSRERQVRARAGESFDGIDPQFEATNPGQKAWFGSSSPYEQQSSGIIYEDPIVARASYSRGGFSRVWGATNDFFSDLGEWPSEVRPADQDLNVVRELVPASTTVWPSGDLEVEAGEVVGSARSLKAMHSLAEKDRGRRWKLTSSKVAIESDPTRNNRCRHDGRCLSGCPFDSIWFSRDIVEEWSRKGLVAYRPGIVVRAWEEGDLAHLEVSDESGNCQRISGRRIFFAAGAISTAALLIRSGIAEELKIQDTSTAFGAAIALRPQGPRGRPHHGLSQWWIRPAEGNEFMAQVYPPSDEHAHRLQAMLPGGRFLGGPARLAAERVHPIISYLRSNDSDPLILKKVGREVAVSGHTSARTKRTMSRHLNLLSRSLLSAGYFMPVIATEFSAPGTGYHFGSSLPQGEKSDTAGRPPGWNRIHVVDSSVLPALTVGSITPTVMANAARIARLTLGLAR